MNTHSWILFYSKLDFSCLCVWLVKKIIWFALCRVCVVCFVCTVGFFGFWLMTLKFLNLRVSKMYQPHYGGALMRGIFRLI